MPKAKDITGELGKLRSKQVLPKGSAPVMPLAALERKIAFNGPSFFFWIVIGFFLCLQVGFMFWLVS